MTVQQALAYAGMACFVVAVVLAALAMRCYRVEDIRGVRDDLSGRRRQRRIAAVASYERASHASATASPMRPLPEATVVLDSNAGPDDQDAITVIGGPIDDALD